MAEEELFRFELSGAIFWGAVWLAAYCAGYARQIRAEPGIGYWDAVGSSLFSGFIGFATVSVLDAMWPGYSVDGWHFVGLSALVGLLGKEQERILAHLVNKIMDFMGVPKNGDGTRTPSDPKEYDHGGAAGDRADDRGDSVGGA